MNRKSWIIVGAVASFLLVLCCACAVAGVVWWSATRDGDPAATVEQYLTAVRDDDATRVHELTCERAGAMTRLMADWTDVVDWDITDTEERDRSASVIARVTYTVLGVTDRQRMVFTLVKEGEDDRWRVCGLRATR